MSGRVAGKVALVTGAASGIGLACAQRLAAEGASVVLTDIQDAKGETAAREIGGASVYLRHDVTDENAWIAVVAKARELFGRLDVLVNNAGIGVGGPVTEITLETWRRQQAINVEGVFLGVKHSLPLMREGGGGSIINMSSVAGLMGAANMTSYCATKGAVRLFTKAAAMECAQARDGVRVNSVHPGIIETPIWDTISDTLAGGGSSNAAPTRAMDLDDMTAVATPLGHKGWPADIAEGVLFLASDESRYMTGAELVIDGGMTAR
ncbi:glucose 1-dehydrogenase [Caulobacter mirabilis]|uniref:D-xylose 1-dehydrogenase n=1 Tax=Caulobacter mirabilis TaxID=69666 RepID=A0A2D2AUC1_9CAUL|nr:glucose 1-dehydrogenase [Caulobacter mirabilis]ATQ41563.1 dehydrogenase [Caulobacter mirabilis]